jgi:DNA polymerase elongation subunit (family B)
MFQLIDAFEVYQPQGSEKTVQYIHMIGRKEDGTVHHTRVRNTKNYVYMPVGPQFTYREALQLKEELNNFLIQNPHPCKRLDCPCGNSNNQGYFCFEPCKRERQLDVCAVSGVTPVKARGFAGYEAEERDFLRFELTRSYYAGNPLVRFLNMRQDPAVPPHLQGVFDCTPKAVESFFKETGIAGFSWLRLDGTLVPKEEWPKTNVKIKTIVFDIETPSKERQFPRPWVNPMDPEENLNGPPNPFMIPFPRGGRNDPRPDQGIPIVSIAFCLNSPDNGYVLIIPGEKGGPLKRHWQSKAKIRLYKDEKTMLLAFYKICMEEDVDVIGGFNSNNFDFPYICTRMKVHGMNEWNRWARKPFDTMRFVSSIVGSKQKGERYVTNIVCRGRVFVDLYVTATNDLTIHCVPKSLKNVCLETGVGKKVDLPHTKMYKTFHGSPEKRGFFAYYNEIDAVLTQGYMDKRMVILNMISLCQLFHVLPREQTIRGVSYTVPIFIDTKRYPYFLQETVGDVYVAQETAFIEERDKLTEGEQAEDDTDEEEEAKEDGDRLRKKSEGKIDGYFSAAPPGSAPPGTIVHGLRKDRLARAAAAAAAAATQPSDKKPEATRVRDIPRALKYSPMEMEKRQQKIKGGLVQEGAAGSYGGYFMDPVTFKKYMKVILVFDFNALYPSIMNALNMCLTTFLLRPEESGLVEGRDYVRAQNGACFVKPHIRKGIIATVALELIEARKQIKADMAKEKDPLVKLGFKAQETAVKTGTNAMYGATGMKSSRIALCSMTDAVTAEGRTFITKTINYIVGYEGFKDYEPRLIYGDTDSCFIEVKCDTLDHGREIFAKMCHTVNTESGIFSYPMKIGMDSMNVRFIFGKKKMYVLLKVSEKVGDSDKVSFVAKGFNFIKGDSIPHVKKTASTILEGITEDREQWNNARIRAYVREQFGLMLANKVPKSEMLVTQKITKTLDKYKVTTKKERINLVRFLKEEEKDTSAAAAAATAAEEEDDDDDDDEWERMSRYEAMKYLVDEVGNPHVISARQLVRAGYKINPGDYVQYCLCRTPYENDSKSSAALAKELCSDFELSIGKYVDKFVKPLQKFLDVLFADEGGVKDLFDLRTYPDVHPSVRRNQRQKVFQSSSDSKKKQCTIIEAVERSKTQ